MLRSPVAPLRRILKDQRRELSRFYVNKRVEGRNADGTINVRPLTGECVERSNICTAYQGQIIQVPCGAGLMNLGAAGTAMARVSRVGGRPWVESLTPDYYEPGEAYTVAIAGRGFRESFDIDFLAPEPPGGLVLNSDITKIEVRVIDSESAEVDIEVAADAAPIAVGVGSIAFDNVGVAP